LQINPQLIKNMKKKSLHKGQHVLVVGAGKSGMAACRLLHSKGCEVCLSDTRQESQQDPEDVDWLKARSIVQEFGGHHLATFMVPDLIVVSPGVPLTIDPLQAARTAGVPIIGELELGFLYFTGAIIAITGTNGKTTVTTMIGESLRHSGMNVFVGGNIGTPFCSHVLEENQAEVAVLEVSSFQLDANRDFKPKVGVLLNISPDHLDRYASYTAYGDAKMQLFKQQNEQDVALISGTDREIARRRSMIPARVVEFDNDSWRVNAEERSLTWVNQESGAETYGLHDHQLSRPNLQNCMAAIGGSRLMGATRNGVQEMLNEFAIPLHRLTPVGSWNDIEFVNDSKATNVGAVQSALSGMHRPVILIAGGRDKGGDYAILCPEVKRIVKQLIVMGEAAQQMTAAFTEITTVHQAADMEDAVNLAVAHAEQGDTILLSPACASFDMYGSYAERGNVFMEQVQRVMGKYGTPATVKTIQRAV
jgi:UDP-N-acetylmuramoylalanine--D-glutamate ligase